MPDGISHHPLTGKDKAPPPGHTRVCYAGAYGAATRAVRAQWDPATPWYDQDLMVAEEVAAAIDEVARASMINGTHCNCATRRGSTRARRQR